MPDCLWFELNLAFSNQQIHWFLKSKCQMIRHLCDFILNSKDFPNDSFICLFGHFSLEKWESSFCCFKVSVEDCSEWIDLSNDYLESLSQVLNESHFKVCSYFCFSLVKMTLVTICELRSKSHYFKILLWLWLLLRKRDRKELILVYLENGLLVFLEEYLKLKFSQGHFKTHILNQSHNLAWAICRLDIANF